MRLAKPIYCSCVLSLAVCLVVWNAGAAAKQLDAEEPSAARTRRDATEFRRVFVPADAPATWPIGVERYLPIRNSEFKRLLNADNDLADGSAPTEVRFERASYQADFRSNGLLQVEANLEVELLGTKSKLLPISPLSLSILSANWQGGVSQDASLGLWQQPNGSMVSAILVEQSGTLVIQGILAGSKRAGNLQEFHFETPAIVPQTLELRLPPNHTVEISHAQLLKTEPEPSGESRWLFQLSPQKIHRIQVRQNSEAYEESVRPLVSQSTLYQLDPTRLEYVTELQIDALESNSIPLRTLIPAGTRVVDVAIEKQKIPWNVSEDQGLRFLVIERPQTGGPQLISIRCLAKPRTGSSWELPKLRFEKVAWREGTSRLLIPSELELHSLVPRQCVIQNVVGIDGEPGKEEIYHLQEWSSNASIEIQVARPKPLLEVQTLARLDLASDEAKAKILAKLTNKKGHVFQAQAEIAPGWIVDSVKAVPKSAIREWHVNPAEAISTIHLQFNQSVSAQHPILLEIVARNTSGGLKLPTAGSQLKLLQFLEANSDIELFHLSTTASAKLTLADRVSNLRTTSAEAISQLPDEFVEVIRAEELNGLIDVSRLGDTERIEMSQEAAQYSAQLYIEIDAFPDSLRHTYEIDCQIHSGTVSEIVLESQHILPNKIQWDLVGKKGTASFERINSVSDVNLSDPRAVKYKLSLPEPTSGTLRLRAKYSQAAKSLEHCNLLRLPETVRWSEQVVLRGSLEEFDLHDRGLTPSAQRVFGNNISNLPVLGSYRIEPQDFRRGSGASTLLLSRRTAVPSTPKLVAWFGEYQTVQAANGDALHSANYSLENSGERLVTLRLPETTELLEAWLNSQQIEINKSIAEENIYELSLGSSERWHHLGLKYSTRGPALGGSAKIGPVLPECSFPISHARWTLWAPEQYEIDKTQRSYSPQKYHWWKRVFGPLARARGETVFNPLSTTGWSKLWSAPLAVQNSKQLTGSLAHQLAKQIESEPQRSLGALLLERVERNGLESLFCIDQTAMLARGLQSDTLCTKLTNDGGLSHPVGIQARPLSSYDLALIASPGAIVLTTSVRVAHWRDQLRPTRVPGVFLVTSEDLSDSLAKLRRSASPDYLAVRDWLRIPAATQSLWDKTDSTSLADVGRQARTVEFSTALPTLVVRQAYVRTALWYAVLLLTLVLGVWQLAHFPNFMILTGAVAGAACLVVPAYWLTLPQAMFLGLVAAAMVRVVLKSSHFGESSWKTTHHVTTAICMVIASATQPDVATAQPTKQTLTDAKQDLPKVLIPIDSNAVQQGEDVYLPEDFLKRLQALPQRGPRDGAEVVILAAEYEGSLSNQSETHSTDEFAAVTRPWTLRWKVETYLPNRKLVLPLRQREAIWSEGAHQLDGLPVELEWLPDDGGCSITVTDAGTHWLRLTCRPRISKENSSAQLRMHLPALPGASLRLTRTPEINNLLVKGAGLDSNSTDSTLEQFVLAPHETLDIRWNSDPANSTAQLWDRLEQSSWLTIEPNSARLDVQLRFVGARAALHEVDLEIPAQLTLLAPTSDSPVTEVIAPDPNRPSGVQIVLRPDLPSEFVVPLSLELNRSTAIGQVYFPKVGIAGSSPGLHLFAVSVSSGLSYDERRSNDMRSLEPKEFMATWNQQASSPLFAYALSSQIPDWSLRVWPDPRSLRAEQNLRLHCRQTRVDVEFEAKVDDLTGSWHSHHLRLPEALQIDAITVQDENQGEFLPVRWSRPNPTEASIFLSRPLQRAHSVSLRGHIDSPTAEEIELPQILLKGSSRGEMQLELYRSESVQVDWANPDLAPEQSRDYKNPPTKQEIHVGSFLWRASRSSQLSKLQVKKNETQFTTRSLTSLERTTIGWKALLSSRISVRRGVLSRLQIAIPNNVRAPYKLLPEHVGTIRDIVDTADGKQLSILLAEPVSESQEIKIQLAGTLNLPGDGSLVIPALRWSGAVRSNRYLLLPTLVDKESITWQRSGLVRQALPLPLVEFATQQQPAHCFRIEQDQFEAKQRNSQRAMRNAQIRHTKIAGFLDANGDLVATAEMMIQPGRASFCAVQLPEQAELLQLVAGDQPARRERRANGNWHLPIGPAYLPQRILVSYRCQANGTDDQLLLAAPKVLLGDRVLPAPKTWWHLRTPQSLLLRPTAEEQLASEREVIRQDYEVPLQIVQDAFSQALELPSEEGQAWAQTWQAIIRQAERVWQAHGPWSSEEADMAAATETLLALEDIFAEEENPDSTNAYRTAYPVYRNKSLDVVAKRDEYYFVSDSDSPLVVTTSLGSQRNPWQWLTAIALVSGVLAIVSRLRHHPEYYHDLCHWPHSLALAVGFAWWLLLKPSALGMLVIVFTIISLALQRWRTHRQDKLVRPDSQIVVIAGQQ